MSRADHNQKDIVKILRQVGASVEILSQQGNGCPDLLVGWFGTNYLFEVKNEARKKRFTPDQKKFHAKWKGKIFVIASPNEALKVLGVD